MKKISLFLVMLLSVTTVVSANNVDDPRPVSGMAVMKTGSTFKVFYKAIKAGTVKVSILDAKHDEVFTETFHNIENFVRPYNFSSLQEGEYTIEVSNNDGKQIEHVTYRKGNLQRLAHLARVEGSSDKYILSLSNKGQDQISVKIYNESNTLLYSQLETISGDFAKIYCLNNVSGQLSFEITDKNGITTVVRY
jgi:hypothetical protein